MMRSRFKLPGFGWPLNYTPPAKAGELFKNALNENDVSNGSVALSLTTLREFTMLHLMNQLTDKPDWDKKVFDKDITSKWKSEALATEGLDITAKMVDWCIAELQYKANIFKETGAVSIYNGDVVKSDTAIPEDLKERLKLAVASLENIPARLKDWHPGSDEKVLDLVHPSLFPLVYGRTRILPNSLTSLEDCIKLCGEGTVVPVPPKKETKLPDQNDDTQNPYSSKFQWLPSEVDISGKDESVKFTSYINNLHPHIYKDLYSIVEQVISKAIPLWNMTLTPLKAPDYKYERITYTECVYDPDPEANGETPERLPDEEDEEYEERTEEWYKNNRKVVKPEPGEFKPPTVPDHMRKEYFNKGTETLKPKKTVDLRRDFGKRGLQIIVKLANIHLTPEKPEYEGGSWHVEGQLNEHICSTAIYYYDSANITTSRLAFRQSSNGDDAADIEYEQDHHDWLEVVFGCEPNGPSIQEVGAVDTKEGRLVTFPNILQHQVQPFKLADPTQPGHRKILALFLVDPNIRIISTANIPCQQREWWSDAIQQNKGAVSKLPVELQEKVFKGVEDFPIGLDEAKALRLELMEERKKFVVSSVKAFESCEISLCEH